MLMSLPLVKALPEPYGIWVLGMSGKGGILIINYYKLAFFESQANILFLHIYLNCFVKVERF